MIPEEYTMMELMAMQQFSASSDPYSAHASCSVGWKLLVEVNVKAGYAFWPTGQITIFLERVGAITGLKKGEAKNLTATRTMIRRDTSARFEGISKKKYKIRVLIDQENWFQWTSAEVARTLNDGDDVTVQIELTPHLVLVEMTSVSAIGTRHAADATCQDDYGLTATVTAGQIQGVIGADSLREGSISSPRMVAGADRLEALLGFTNPPYFAVVDINKAHQMSYFLACLAFHKFGRRQRKLVINFDNHTDYGGGAGDVNFDKWGKGFFSNAESLTAILGDGRVVYTILGQTEMVWTGPVRGAVKQYYYSNSHLDGTVNDPEHILQRKTFTVDDRVWVVAKKAPGSVADTWNLEVDKESMTGGLYPFAAADLQALVVAGVLEHVADRGTTWKLYKLAAAGPAANTLVANYQAPVATMYQRRDQTFTDLVTCPGSAFLDPLMVGDLSQTDVYITVDRDVSKGSYTYWNDGYLTAALMRDAVDRCLAYLKAQNANLVGFDVAGLPDTLGCSTSLDLHGPQGTGRDPGAQEPAILQQARDDIRHFLNAVITYGPTA